MSFDASSTRALVVTNIVTIALAWFLHWPLVTLLWPYWLQSLVIGWYSRKRILALRDFSLQGTSGFDRGSPEATKKSTASFFVAHYGIFNLWYCSFLVEATRGRVPRVPGYQAGPLDLAVLAAAALSFIVTCRATYSRIIEADQRARPNIGFVMFLPYLRVIPMHITIAIGLSTGHSSAILLFGALKTAADALMHWIEYRIAGATVESAA